MLLIFEAYISKLKIIVANVAKVMGYLDEWKTCEQSEGLYSLLLIRKEQ